MRETRGHPQEDGLIDAPNVPLVVDVDGSLIAGDLLIEGALRLLRQSPFDLLRLPFWRCGTAQGRAALKHEVAESVPLPPETLVLNTEVEELTASARRSGRPVWLASGADELVVRPLAESVGADGYLASDGRTNLVGETKARALVERFGARGFDYVGNERRDLPVWAEARHAIGVDVAAATVRKLKAIGSEPRLLRGARGDWVDWICMLRPHQWTKNLLVFVPILAAHVGEVDAYLTMAGVFLALSCCASGGYVINDLLDLPHDRRHPRKRQRHLAAGRVSALPAAALAVVLVAGGLLAAFRLSESAGVGLTAYVLGALGYSLWFKRFIVVDVIVLALLYGVRIAMGATESAVLSPWLLFFSLFLFTALAVVKRQAELADADVAELPSNGGRGYVAGDAVALTALGAASAVASAVVLALYVQSADTLVRYARPEVLGLVCPLLVYWLGRLVVLANRGVVHDDPIVFALRDRVSWGVALGVCRRGGRRRGGLRLMWRDRRQVLPDAGDVKLSGWGRYPVIDCAVERLREWRDLEGLLEGDGTLIARGNGRAYGDAAMNRALTVSMLGMDRMQAFDATTGLLTCESGVLLGSIMDSFVPRGWMPFVVPGTAHVTVGGMVAADVHGKNHHRDGSFGAHVESLCVLTGQGETVRCSRSENADLFHATVGGMGLTGVIRSATFRMRRVHTGWVCVETLAADDLEEAMALFEASRECAYSVAWIDCMTRGAKLGRSLLYRGMPLDRNVPRDEAVAWSGPRFTPTIRVDAPTALLNGATASLFNALYFAAGRRRAGSRPTPLGAFFFPLDRVAAWNRLYGRRGFAQYQCVLPKSESERGLRALLERVAASRSGSFLAVLKLLGDQGMGHLSFPMEGYTLALDVPMRPGTTELLDALDDITHAHGGRVYLAKDAFCRPERLRLGYPSLEGFAAVREATGGRRFASALSERLGL